MKLHILRCGTIRLAPSAVYGGGGPVRRLLAPDARRLALPVFCYLIEHPRGPVLVDTGLCRALSPAGVYDAKAAARVLPPALAAFLRPSVAPDMTAAEQLAAMGISPGDLALVILTHLDADHVAGLRSLRAARDILLPEDEYFWSCRTVYRVRQPRALWFDLPVRREFYRGSPLGPKGWAIDVFGDESLQLVNLPGHTDGQAAVLVRGGSRYVVLAADAAFSPRNWREERVPGFGFDRGLQLRSLRWLAEAERDPACVRILCSHDPDVATQTLLF